MTNKIFIFNLHICCLALRIQPIADCLIIISQFIIHVISSFLKMDDNSPPVFLKDHSKPKLSKHILQMKFMQKCKEKLEKEEEKKQTEEFFETLNLPKLSDNGIQFISEPSYVKCEDLLFGRMSFKEFNIDVEKLMKKEEPEEEEVKEDISKEGMTDEEMAARFCSLVGTIAKKYGKKRKSEEEYKTVSPKQNKPEFLKPKDE